VVCDVTDERQVKDLANTVLSKFEHVDVVINCAVRCPLCIFPHFL
jgi:NAD(P)-dependent dehydrogenase (short-subunit alcohol dehydrogenase family)